MPISSDDFSGAFMAEDDNMREAIVRWLSDNGWSLRDLQTDSAVTRDTAARKHADDLMYALSKVRVAFGSDM